MVCKTLASAFLVAAGCTVGAPSGFSAGDHWTFPLVGPLEDGLLITPVTVKGHGPYLFAIDPDANISAVDKQIVDDAGLRTSAGPKIIDETATGQTRLYAELMDLRIATLTIARRDVLLFDVGFYDTENRHLSGILGRDVIADSLVFGFDRDQGIATLSTTKAFTPPANAIAIRYEDVSGSSGQVAGKYPEGTGVARGSQKQPGGADLTKAEDPGRARVIDPYGNDVPSRINEAERQNYRSNDVLPAPRRLATARIGGAKLAMHLDLGAAFSQLSESSWTSAHLTPTAANLRVVDEAASVRRVTRLGVADDVALGEVKASHVAFAPFVEQRFGKAVVDGALGLDFFRAYAVYVNWDRSTFYVKARGDAGATAAARLGRWGAALPACPHPGCATAKIAEAAGGAGFTLEVMRDAEAANRGLELLVGVTSSSGKPMTPLIVELPRGVDQIVNGLPADYAGATIAVLDASPFPRPCVGDGGCVVPLDDALAHGAAR